MPGMPRRPTRCSIGPSAGSRICTPAGLLVGCGEPSDTAYSVHPLKLSMSDPSGYPGWRDLTTSPSTVPGITLPGPHIAPLGRISRLSSVVGLMIVRCRGSRPSSTARIRNSPSPGSGASTVSTRKLSGVMGPSGSRARTILFMDFPLIQVNRSISRIRLKIPIATKLNEDAMSATSHARRGRRRRSVTLYLR